MDYSYNTDFNIGFKPVSVKKKDPLCLISAIIHSGAKNDSKIYEEVLQELKRMHLLMKKVTILIKVIILWKTI